MVEVVSLGCRLNISESEELRGLLSADDNLVVVNSCAVTTEAVRQTRQAIRRVRRKNPQARLLVTGCAAEVERKMLVAMPEVDGLIANQAKLDRRAWNVPPAAQRQPRHYSRAFVQVQNGCDHACTFCVIPQGRGPSRSRAVEDVCADIQRHREAGINEIVLTGVDLTSWGNDIPEKPSLGKLITSILKTFPELPRLRLSSIDGAEVDRELFDLLAFHPRVMPHVHLSLQSGDDMILKRMKRRHSRQNSIDLVQRLRTHRADLALGADIIAGFPTETDEMHGNNLSIIKELGIVHGHVFPFSARPGTPAARMPKVDTAVTKHRAAELRRAVTAQRDRWLNGLLGRRLKVLAEKDGTGHSENFAPVRLVAPVQPGSIVEVEPKRIVEGMLE